ncbi:serine/threonine protein kinase [Oscillatoria sp. FACHB-1407]|uniref:serine/threonine-protein kinase n=1 Tax=Oscillatoria sp. FACHB-1407 TaxID=2692847 RepID=UPI001685AF8B|nr:serine/threonine-protein kinase [Oscillatoria sp. FACHB-1407]MBD2462137.1 serine/threonine protein kinase [Oscillatoria sp. FACHB-1407]
MSYCFNPLCRQPQNPSNAQFCQNCGSKLVLNGAYRALKLIGQGGFGRTFLAVSGENSETPFYCVIKQFLPRQQGVANLQKAAELFRQEAERLKQLGQHPQIPQLLDYFELDGEEYLVQEFIDGQNLEEVLASEGAFSEAQVRKVLNDLLPVLQFIHHHRVIHRDIKPENIIYPHTEGQPAQDVPLILVDFGASKFASATALARTGTVIGSAGYVAPEQAMGKAEFASDIYSLGVTCVHLLTGLHPFDLYSVSEDAWVWRQYLADPISRRLAIVLTKMLQKATSQRYDSAAAVLHDLNQTPRITRGERRSPETQSQRRLTSEAELPPRAAQARRQRILQQQQDWQAVSTLTGHTGAVTAIALNPNGTLLASGSSDKTIRLWSIPQGELLYTIPGRSLWSNTGHSDRISALGFALDGQTLISGSDDSTIKIWDVATRRLVVTLPSRGWDISALTASQTGTTLVSGGGDGVIYVWDLKTRELVQSLHKHLDRVSALILSPDDRILVSGSYDKTIRVWDLRKNTLINTFKGHGDRISTLAVTPDWYTLVSGSWDRTLRIWDLPTGDLRRTLAAHRDRTNCLAISPDGYTLASASEDSTIKLWELEEGIPLHTFQQAWGINVLTFTPDSRMLISGSADETIKIWQRRS